MSLAVLECGAPNSLICPLRPYSFNCMILHSVVIFRNIYIMLIAELTVFLFCVASLSIVFERFIDIIMYSIHFHCSVVFYCMDILQFMYLFDC